MRHLRLLIPALVIAAACRDTPSVTAPSLDRATANASLATSVTDAATGGGRYLLQGVLDVQFAFTAIQRGNGKVSGNFHQRLDNEGQAIDFRAKVTCMATDPTTRRAWIGGVITQNRSTDPAFLTPIHQPGKDIWFRVVDYGEGEASPPDRITFMGFEGSAGFETSIAYCLGRPWPEGDERTWPVTAGNIQVLR